MVLRIIPTFFWPPQSWLKNFKKREKVGKTPYLPIVQTGPRIFEILRKYSKKQRESDEKALKEKGPRKKKYERH